jgi:hypothetical protein
MRSLLHHLQRRLVAAKDQTTPHLSRLLDLVRQLDRLLPEPLGIHDGDEPISHHAAHTRAAAERFELSHRTISILGVVEMRSGKFYARHCAGVSRREAEHRHALQEMERR